MVLEELLIPYNSGDRVQCEIAFRDPFSVSSQNNSKHLDANRIKSVKWLKSYQGGVEEKSFIFN